jgi:2-polyprenyl-6-methoxyphenol hydroxylase-like FAD-dependent oxidoreductase
MSSHNAPSLLGRHAIVIGGSIAGLLTARVLSDYFEQVTVVDRDVLKADAGPRKGVPQGRHVHLLLHKGQAIIERLLPGIFQNMGPDGSVQIDLGADMRWLHLGVLSMRAATGTTSQFQTRPALEYHVRRRVEAIHNIALVERTEVTRLLHDADAQAVTGVELRSAGDRAALRELSADLVVDASGRASHTPRWLESLGYKAPPETTVEIDFAYASRLYQRPAHLAVDWKVLICYPNPPKERRGAYIFPIENDGWIVTMGSRLGDRPPGDEEGFMDFARSLPHPDVYEAIRDAVPITPITTFRFLSNRRRHYEKLRRFPDRLVVLGDALCSFNPIYGQGMTICAREVEALQRYLSIAGHGGVVRAARRFRGEAARIVAIPWMLVTGEDFRYPETRGARPPLVDLINWYTRKIHELTVTDSATLHALIAVMQMERHPLTLYAPSIVFKVLRLAFSKRARALHVVSPATHTDSTAEVDAGRV